MRKTDQRRHFIKHQAIHDRKLERLAVLKALLATHESTAEPDRTYVRDLRRRIKQTEIQLQVMQGTSL